MKAKAKSLQCKKSTTASPGEIRLGASGETS